MKLLWVKTDFLHPTDRGGQIRTLETLRPLHKRHEIHYVAFADPSRPEGPRRVGEYSARAFPVEQAIVSKRSPRFALQLAAGLTDSLPVAVRRWSSATMRQTVADLIAREQYDRIICDFPFPAPNIPDMTRAVLFQHNVETMIWRRHAAAAPDPLRRAYLEMQARRMFAFERDLCRRAAYVIAVSAKDANTMRQEFGISHVDDVPTGVDIEFFARPQDPEPQTDIVFLGSMDWMANVDGAGWFASEVLPLIRQQRPDCRLALVGRDPSPAVQQLAQGDPRILVTGTVPDVRPWLWGASVSIVPLRVGGGTRLKIFEAMAAGTATVSTTIGAEGLPVEHNRHLLIADTAPAFAAACIDLMNDGGRRQRLSFEAWELVKNRYSWESAALRFEQLLERAPRATSPKP
jgi:glycosyltransferase involved in cell wall biosynthesis